MQYHIVNLIPSVVKNFIKHKMSWLYRAYRDILNLRTYKSFYLSEPNYEEYWNDKRGDQLGKCNSFQKYRANWIVNKINPGSSVLDYGCGDGAVLLQMQSKKEFKPIGADISNKCLNFLSDNDISTIEINTTHDSIFKYLPDVDHVLLLEVLEHMPDPENFLLKVAHKTRKSIFISFPNTGYFTYRMRLLFGRFPVQWRVHPGEHLRFWTYKDTYWWLNELGFLSKSNIHVYEGIPFLNRIFRGLFGAAIIIQIRVDK